MHEGDKFQQLRNFYLQLVPGMSAESWEIVARSLTIRTVKKRDFILREGAVCNHVSFINQGLVRMFYNTEERENTICFFKENEYVSDYPSFLTRRPAQTNIQALETTEIVETNYEALQLHYQQIPEANYLGRLLAEELFIIMNETRIEELKSTIEERYNRIIERDPWILQRIPQYMVASYLGITAEALSRVKNRISARSRVLARVY